MHELPRQGKDRRRFTKYETWSYYCMRPETANLREPRGQRVRAPALVYEVMHNILVQGQHSGA